MIYDDDDDDCEYSDAVIVKKNDKGY